MSIDSIVHLIPDAGPHPYFRTLVEGDRHDRRRLTIGCLGPAGALQDDMRALGVQSFALGVHSRADFPAATFRLARLLRARRAQVVQTHLVDASLVGLSAARLARTPAAVFTAHHCSELPYHGWRLRLPDSLCARPLCDAIIAPSAQVAEVVARETGVALAKVSVVHHGVDLARLDPTRVSGDSVRAELGLDGALVIGSVGRLYPLKDHASLIRAFAAVLGETPEARLVVVGDGDPEPLCGLARSLEIGERVIFTGPRGDVPEILAAFDLLVHPSLAETFGLAIVEAMAMGVPVVSTPVGVAPEIVATGVTGVLTRTTGTVAVTDGLREGLELRGRWREISAAARAAVAGFTGKAMADNYERVYERAVASS